MGRHDTRDAAVDGRHGSRARRAEDDRLRVRAGSARGGARAGLAVRVVLGVMAALAIAVGVVAWVNLRAVSTFNQATQSLSSNIAEASSDTPDYNRLSTLQEQTDAQFDDAAAAGAALLPQIRKAIDTNARVSDKLSQLVRLRLSEQEEGSSSSSSSNAESSQSSDGSSSEGSGTSQDGGLTEEQRKQVEELLKANEQSTPAQSESTTTDESQSETTNNTGNTSKPW
ncbi:DUF6466 family protein [Bifidobacterium aerophilum]|uniref:Cell surface protein n=1 Tax=Bifidobacterium aerophilum TaxID=1798155 RepID=A0A6N9Z2Z3_9BIFI|nr:DUF6466 family protein [Bifidobacterium aerophilum]NEG88623.1 cell surface protein [Bifidobacterium aerophilum]